MLQLWKIIRLVLDLYSHNSPDRQLVQFKVSTVSEMEWPWLNQTPTQIWLDFRVVLWPGPPPVSQNPPSLVISNQPAVTKTILSLSLLQLSRHNLWETGSKCRIMPLNRTREWLLQQRILDEKLETSTVYPWLRLLHLIKPHLLQMLMLSSRGNLKRWRVKSAKSNRLRWVPWLLKLPRMWSKLQIKEIVNYNYRTSRSTKNSDQRWRLIFRDKEGLWKLASLDMYRRQVLC